MPGQQAGGQVRAAEREQLAVLVDLLVATQRERPRQDARVGRRHERDPERGRDEGQDVATGERRDASAAGARPAAGRRRRSRSVPTGRTTALTTVEPTTATRMPGIPGRHWRSPRMMTRHVTPIARATVFVSPCGQAGHERARPIDHAVAVGREPEQPGQLADDDDERDAVEVAVADGRGQEAVRKPSRASPAPMTSTPTITARSARQRRRPGRRRRPRAGRSPRR